MFVKVGAWKNVDELEDNLTLAELDLLLKSIRKDQNETRVFQAAIQGIDLNKYATNSVEEKRKEIERNAKEAVYGYAEVEKQEFADYGISFSEI